MNRVKRALRERLRRLAYLKAPFWASALRKRWVIAKNPNATIVFEGAVFLGPGFTIDAPHGGTVIIGNGVQFRRNCRIELATPEARVAIGEGSYITYNAIIACSSTIAIGKHCGLGFCSSIYDGSHRYKDLTKPFLAQGYDLRPITIEDHVQIHSLCTVVNSIGTRTVIGANSVVSRELPPYVLAVGAPARPIEEFGPSELGSEPRRVVTEA
jgi:acetyltransferase-like isoleucine patch superfamily enzyme